jgi:hypothetical protein
MLNKITKMAAEKITAAGKVMKDLELKENYMDEERLIKAIAEYEEKIRKLEERLVEVRNERIGLAS